jgi:hypothetical protein
LTVRLWTVIIGPAMNLILSLACEDARQRPDGRLDFVGVFDELQAPGFPAAQDRMTVVFVMEWAPEEHGRREFRADLIDEGDRKVLTIEGHTDVAARHGGGPARTQLIMPLERVVFPEAGEYRFLLAVEDRVIPAFSLHVREQSD